MKPPKNSNKIPIKILPPAREDAIRGYPAQGRDSGRVADDNGVASGDPSATPLVDDVEDERIDPDDERICTLSELQTGYREEGFTKEEIDEFWERDCRKVGGPPIPKSDIIKLIVLEESARRKAWKLEDE